MRFLAPARLLRLMTAAVVVAAGLAFAGCSSSGGASGIACPAKVDATVYALDGIKFSPETLHAKAGAFVVKLVNKSGTNHTFQIRGLDGKATVAPGNHSGCERFTLTSGTYNYICGIPGHASTMHGILTVS